MIKILDGKMVAQKRLTLAAVRVAACSRPLTLAVILVGENSASQVYVKHKQTACQQVGIHSIRFDLSSETSEAELLELLYTLNADRNITGILVQLPLPAHIKTQTIIEAINPQKDVDGFHPYNLGRLAQGIPAIQPCTP